MQQPYSRSHQYRLDLADHLIPGLRNTPVRHWPVIAKLSQDAQQTLQAGLENGLRKAEIPDAAAILLEDPSVTAEQLVSMQRKAPARPENQAAQRVLAQAIAACWPDMPKLTAQALAHSDSLGEVLEVAQALLAAFAAQNALSELNLLALRSLLRSALLEVDQLVSKNPHLQTALRQSAADAIQSSFFAGG